MIIAARQLGFLVTILSQYFAAKVCRILTFMFMNGQKSRGTIQCSMLWYLQSQLQILVGEVYFISNQQQQYIFGTRTAIINHYDLIFAELRCRYYLEITTMISVSEKFWAEARDYFVCLSYSKNVAEQLYYANYIFRSKCLQKDFADISFLILDMDREKYAAAIKILYCDICRVNSKYLLVQSWAVKIVRHYHLKTLNNKCRGSWKAISGSNIFCSSAMEQQQTL
jgi:hypothetical protein